MTRTPAHSPQNDLTGLTILDLSHTRAGQHAAHFLAAAGADVVHADDTTPHATLATLAQAAHAILVSPTPDHPTPGLSPNLGDIAGISTTRIVAITPFGLTGPRREWRSSHLVASAASGLLGQHHSSDGPVEMPGQPLAAYVGMHVAGIVIADAHAPLTRTGPLDLAEHDILSAMNFSYPSFAGYGYSAPAATDSPDEFGGRWPCRDGVVEFLVSSPTQWAALVALLGDPVELSDPDLADFAVRAARLTATNEAIGRAIAPMTRDEFLARGQHLGVPCSVVNTVAEFMADPHTIGRGLHVRDLPVARKARPHEVPERRELTPLDVSSLRVVSLGTVVAGGSAAAALASLGLDVVRVESRARPDTLRRFLPPGQPTPRDHTGAPVSATFAHFNRGVRSVELDLGTPDGTAALRDLIDRADILIDNFSPRVMPSWGLDSATLRERNPGLIHLAITGFGTADGPRSSFPAYGATICSFVGLTDAWGFSSQTHFDFVSHAFGIMKVIGALSRRTRTGAGCFIDLAMIDAAAATLRPLMHPETPSAAAPWPGIVQVGAESRWIAIDAATPAHVEAAAHATGLATSAMTPAALGDWASQVGALAAVDALQAAGVPAAVVATMSDIGDDPQLRARKRFVEVTHPGLEALELLALPHHGTLAPVPRSQELAGLGEHSAVVAAEWGARD